MIKFFRGIRQALLTENKFRKYLLYAAGEVILVVIGILIALSINNWNERRHESERLTSIYKTIHINLTTDTANASRVIRFHEKIDELIDRQLKGELTDEFIATMDSTNYAKCEICYPVNSTYDTFFPQKKGMLLLQNFVDNSGSSTNDLSTRIIQFYSEYVPVIEGDMKRIEDMVLDNVDQYEEQVWYIDLIYGKYVPEVLKYIQSDMTYRNSLVSYKMLSTHNYLKNLKTFKAEALILMEEIESYLETVDS